ncbi:MAG: BamA/TamA family outer membrane protein, partial [Phycisphaerales bacterium]|nr:BamA/TamA family outer membrane protein [Phycisphaerales bacterium]
DVRAIQDRYGELGYIYAKVRPTRVFSDTPGFVRLTIEIEEGDQFRVGRVAVRGNARTKDKVVRRALNLYPPDDLFNLTEAKEAEKRLVETRIFSSARVIPVGDEPAVRDAVIDVVEAEKAGDFLFGVGVTSNSGLVGSVVLDLQNFDLFDTPRSWAEFFKLRSFYGGGQRLRIELQPGTQVSRFRIDFTEPYLFDKPIRYDSSLFLFERGRDGYHESRVGTTNSFGKRFESGPLQGWSGEIAFRSELVGIDDVDIFAAHEIRKDEGSNFINGIKGTLVRDRTDNRFVPTAGDRLRINYEQVGLLGGDLMFGRLGLAYNWYKTLAVDRQERKRVLALRGEGGMIVGDAPVWTTTTSAAITSFSAAPNTATRFTAKTSAGTFSLTRGRPGRACIAPRSEPACASRSTYSVPFRSNSTWPCPSRRVTATMSRSSASPSAVCSNTTTPSSLSRGSGSPL